MLRAQGATAFSSIQVHGCPGPLIGLHHEFSQVQMGFALVRDDPRHFIPGLHSLLPMAQASQRISMHVGERQKWADFLNCRPGLIQGLLRSFTATIDRSPAEIIVLPPKAKSLMGSTVAELPARLRPQMWLHPEVSAVDTWEFPVAEWANMPPPGGKQVRTFVRVSMADPGPGSVTVPVDFPAAARSALATPLSVVVDGSALAGLGVKQGDTVILRGQTLTVRAVVRARRRSPRLSRTAPRPSC